MPARSIIPALAITLTASLAVAQTDPDLRVEIGPSNSYLEFENSQLLVRYEPFFDKFEQFGIRSVILKAAGNEEQVCCETERYIGADANRGHVASITLVYDGTDRKTVRLVWYDKNNNPANTITQEDSIYANGRFIRTDVINARVGLNFVDIGTPGGAFTGTHIAYGGDAWIRGYVTQEYSATHGSYYNRYPGDGVNDPANGGSLNYHDHFIVGVYNPANGHGFGRVIGVADCAIVKLLVGDSERKGMETFPYPFFLSHPPYTTYAYFFTGGPDEMLSAGMDLADGILSGPEPPPCPADLDDSGAVDLTDLGILLGNYGQSPATPEEGDVNDDDSVDLTDVGLLLGQYGDCPT